MTQPDHHVDVSPTGTSTPGELQSFYVRAQYDFSSPDASALAFVQGDIIEVLTQLPSGWWDGLLDGVRGWFPSNYVERMSEEEVESLIAEMTGEAMGTGQGYAIETLSNGQVHGIGQASHAELASGSSRASIRPQPAPDLGLAPGIEIDDDDADWLRREMEREVGFDDLARGMMEGHQSYEEESHGDHEITSQNEPSQIALEQTGAVKGNEPQRSEEVEGDFWVPSMTSDGQVSIRDATH